ncbi:hypothetical protein TanjilG_14560 [Lupinus angustifolius]|uniref:Sacsin/Nov domain-containing protein n=1 Tax=Lupinus angustifolius TaxID=3871 RepID=A0A1J7FYU9_LUPAN|nr:PREDICTED: uncharacterized protein LOC109332095 [Lupinus angustifolius]OIV93309.1 hypothetical protein TanjilG_14560 [Lupinus angustifolius]
MATPKEHIQEIRRTRFSIGGELNPLAEDLHQAVKNLSVELYAKDVHFLMELIQNAEDNQYAEVVRPTLEFIVTSKDITATGAPATLLIFNNEKGFSPKNIESVCSVGRSTKKGNRRSGYIGEKGIGFKSVFLVTAQPYIFSNGYQIRFNEDPCPHSGLGYIVPEWVEENPTPLDIKKIYGNATLPTTTIVLPLKPEKVEPVKHQLSTIHPEVLLFLSKIKHLSVKEVNEDPKLNSVSSVAISSEVNFMTRKNMNAESYTLHLSAEENGGSGEECSYYMWKQRFPVRAENMVQRRNGVEEWVITLAFPNHERLHRGENFPGVYSYLPTEMVTNFPFIIQADFVLASSRETILLDNKWNLGILECIPSAFMAAFKTLVLASDQAPVSSLPRMFKFLPVDSSSYEKLNYVREKIKEKLVEENIIPIETYSDQKHFYKPSEVRRLLPDFWNVLTKARAEGVYLHNLSSHDGIKILNSSFDLKQYDHILQFLGVKKVNVEWYAKCIQSSNLVDGVSEGVYLELLLFVATNWGSSFSGSSMINIPLIKYVDTNGSISHLSLHQCTQPHGVKRVMLFDSSQSCPCSWLINWNKVFGCPSNRVFMPEVTHHAICRVPYKQTLMDWLESQVNVATVNVYSFAKLVCGSIKKNHRLAILYCHFLYHSKSKGYLSKRDVDSLCSSMPLVDSYGSVIESRNGVLVPANVSKWADLIVSNPWLEENYIELGKEYLSPGNYAGQYTRSGELIEFLKIHVDAGDIPNISPPNAGFSSVHAPLTKDNAFLLLDWIHNLKYKGTPLPKRFLECIKEGSWLKVTINGYRPPSKSFLIRKLSGKLLQSGSVLVDIPLVDESFYGARINEYEEELKTIGVMFSNDEACNFIGEELMSRAAASNLSKSHILLMLNFIKYLRESLLPLDNLVNNIKQGNWLKTSYGLRSPVGSVLYDSDWVIASQISSIPFIDHSYFGDEIFRFKEELKLLGVIVSFSSNFQVVIDNLKPSSTFVSLTAKAVILLLECLKFSGSSTKVITSIKGASCLKTNMGFKTPEECFLLDHVWGCIFEVFDGFPVLDHKFYGDSIFTFKDQLKQIGVIVDFDVVIKKFAALFKQRASQTSFDKQHVYSFLSCLRRLKGTEYRFPLDFSSIIHDQKWLRTRLGDCRSPRQCILYGPEWKTLCAITCLPFLDDSDTCYGKGIHEYKEELKRTGVVTELKDGLKFVPKCLNFPSDPSSIIPESVFSLLECFKHIMQKNNDTLVRDDELSKRLSKNWLKTHVGYRPPDNCLLFDSKWSSYLNLSDGPFIDEHFFGPKIADYKNELLAIGVIVDVVKGCSLLANHLQFHSDTNTIVRIYRFLCENNWKPEDQAAKKIWIPVGDKGGKWVNPEECIIHDKDNLFGSKFHALEVFYDRKILPFFSFALEVKNKPSVDDYVDLWNGWESSLECLSDDNCYKFWMFILQQWNAKTEKTLSEKLMKLPATAGNNEIFLLNKEDVFIGDNLHLMKLFEGEKVFVWFPKQNFAPLDRCKLFDIYRKVGARNFSESLSKEESSLTNCGELNEMDAGNVFNLKGLVKLILGFLASSLNMEPEKRHKSVQGLIDLSFYETSESVTVSYALSLSSGDVINKKENRMVRWERSTSKFFTQKMGMVSGNASLIRYATYFSEAIAEGVLCENYDHVGELIELIKLAYVLECNNEVIEFLMESKNLQIFCEDEEFLSSAFPSI